MGISWSITKLDKDGFSSEYLSLTNERKLDIKKASKKTKK